MGISSQAKVQAELIKLFEFAPNLLEAIKWGEPGIVYTSSWA